MNNSTRFAAPAIAFSAVSFSLVMNGLYGWNYAPFAFGGAAVAVSTLIFDGGKAVMLPALSHSLKNKFFGKAIIQGLMIAGLIFLSLFATLSFFNKIIDGKQQNVTTQITQNQNEALRVQSRINFLSRHKYSNNGCSKPSDGPFTFAHCDLYSKSGEIQKDSIPYLVKQRATLKDQSAGLANITLFWGVKPAQQLTGLDKETIMLSLILLMAVLMEIFSTFGYALLTSRKKTQQPKAKPVAKHAKVVKEPLNTEEESRTLLMQALSNHGLSQRKIADVVGVNQSNVSRALAKA